MRKVEIPADIQLQQVGRVGTVDIGGTAAEATCQQLDIQRQVVAKDKTIRRGFSHQGMHDE